MKDHKEALNNIMENVKNEMLWRLESEYQRGYDDGKEESLSEVRARHIADYHYRRGLNDAWKCVRKIAEMKWEDCEKLFDLAQLQNIIFDFTAQEVMQKIKEYEERQTKKSCSTCKYELNNLCGYYGQCDKDYSGYEPKQIEKSCETCIEKSRYVDGMDLCEDCEKCSNFKPNTERTA